MVLEKLVELARSSISYVGGEAPLYKAHAGLKITASILVIVYLVLCRGLEDALIVSIYPLTLAVLSMDRDLVYRASILSVAPAVVIAVLMIILSPYKISSHETMGRALTALVRVFSIALTGLLTVSTTSPSEFSSIISRITGYRASVTPVLWGRSTMLVLSDLQESISALKLLGVKPHRALIPVAASALTRAEKLAEALYVKGFGVSGRVTPWCSTGSVKTGLILLALSLSLVFSTLLL